MILERIKCDNLSHFALLSMGTRRQLINARLRLGLFLTAVFSYFFLLASFPDRAQALEKDVPALRGSTEMPAPAFLPLDYYTGRARAWLMALEKAYLLLPATAQNRLWDMDCDTEIGRFALASLLFPVEAATPDISASKNIEVFLEAVKDPGARATQILENPDLFLLQLALISDMCNILEKIQAHRPQGGPDSENSVAGLDHLGKSLDEIWNISRALQKGDSVETALDQGMAGKGQFLPVMIRAGEKRLKVQETQAALAIFEEALLRLEQSDREKDSEILKKYLEGRLLRLRGLAHWRQNQLALAEKDLSRALSLLNATGLPLDLRGESYLDLGALRKARRNIAGMCSAYRDACALGLCTPLAASRRQGLCQEN